MIIAALWAVVVVFPWFHLNDHTGPMRSAYLESDTKAECPGIRCSAHGRGPETRTPIYYAAFGKENGDFEGFELNYLVAILLTIMLSFWFIIREVAARMTSASNYWETEYPARRQPFESHPVFFSAECAFSPPVCGLTSRCTLQYTMLLFTSVDYSANSEMSRRLRAGQVEQMAYVIKQAKKEEHERKRDKQHLCDRVALCNSVRKGFESLIFITTLAVTAFGIYWATSNYESGLASSTETCVCFASSSATRQPLLQAC